MNTWSTYSSAAFGWLGALFFSRLTFPTDLKWSCTGTTSLKSLTGVLCPWRGLTSWRLGCGLSLSLRKDWTMGAWPGSGSSSYPKRCSILITAYLNTLPRKLLIICALAWDWETSFYCMFIQTFSISRHTGGCCLCFSSKAAIPTNDCCSCVNPGCAFDGSLQAPITTH